MKPRNVENVEETNTLRKIKTGTLGEERKKKFTNLDKQRNAMTWEIHQKRKQKEKNTKSIAGEEIIGKKKTQEDIDKKEEEHTRRRKNKGKQIKRKITIKRLNSNGEEEAVYKTNIINTDKESDI